MGVGQIYSVLRVLETALPQRATALKQGPQKNIAASQAGAQISKGRVRKPGVNVASEMENEWARAGKGGVEQVRSLEP